MTDVYVATPTQANYDALMRLAEAAGYVWRSGCKPTEKRNFGNYEREPVVLMRENASLEYRYKSYYEGNQDITIETIPNLANIKAIWKISRENRNAFTMKHRLPPHYKSARKLYVICYEYSGTYLTKENEIYEALAVEYKPQESEDMPEKVKLPKGICAYLDRLLMEHPGFKDQYPFVAVGVLREKRSEPSTDELQNELAAYVNLKRKNQWKLIDALRYGYEPEPEPRWGIKAGSYYLNEYDTASAKFTDMQHAKEFGFKSNALYYIGQLGFGEVVDFNKEGKADE